MISYLTMFATALGAATVLPFYSEVVLVTMLGAGLSPLGLWLAATTGNTLGAVINWAIGWKYAHLAGTRWLPISEAHMKRARGWFDRYGYWTLLLSWMPVGGDALTFVGGIMRVRILVFLLLVGLGKGVRYALVILAYEALPVN